MVVGSADTATEGVVDGSTLEVGRVCNVDDGLANLFLHFSQTSRGMVCTVGSAKKIIAVNTPASRASTPLTIENAKSAVCKGSIRCICKANPNE